MKEGLYLELSKSGREIAFLKAFGYQTSSRVAGSLTQQVHKSDDKLALSLGSSGPQAPHSTCGILL